MKQISIISIILKIFEDIVYKKIVPILKNIILLNNMNLCPVSLPQLIY